MNPLPAPRRRRWCACGWMVHLALAACVSLCACGGTRAPERVVLSRLGDADQPGVPAQQVARVVIGGSSRPGVCAPPPLAFSLRVPAGASALRFAVGARGAKEGDLALRVAAAAGAAPLYDERLERRADAAWMERGVPLPVDLGSSRVLSLRGSGTTTRELCIGSLRFEGEAPDGVSRPSFLVILLDTLSAHALGSFEGLTGVSPRIDAFLAEGFDFRRAYAQFPSTLVSHSSLFSGLYPVRHGRYNHPDPRYGRTRPPLRSLVADLTRAGYLTVAFTEDAYVSSSFGFDAGFDAYDDAHAPHFDTSSGDSERTFERAAHWLATVGRDRRFFLFLHTYEVHSPYLPVDAEALAFANAATPHDRRLFESTRFHADVARQNAGEAVFDARDFRRLRALYSGEIQYVDRVLARLLEQLDALGLDERTVVVLTSDHGEQFGVNGRLLHGVGLHNRVLHVPLAFAGPGLVSSGRSDTPVQLVDVLPTLLDLAALPLREDLDGRSLAPLLRGEIDALPERPAFSEERRRRWACDWKLHGDDCLVMRDAVQLGRFKLVQDRDGERGTLYDLEADPDEKWDLSATHRPELARYRALLEAYRRRPPAAPPIGAGEGGPIDPETHRALEALGYVP